MTTKEIAYIKALYTNATFDYAKYNDVYKSIPDREYADRALVAKTQLETLEGVLSAAKVEIERVCDESTRRDINAKARIYADRRIAIEKSKRVDEKRVKVDSKKSYLYDLYLDTLSTEIYRYGEYLNKQQNNAPNATTFFNEYTKQAHARYILALTIGYFYNVKIGDVRDWLGIYDCEVVYIKKEVAKRFNLNENALAELC